VPEHKLPAHYLVLRAGSETRLRPPRASRRGAAALFPVSLDSGFGNVTSFAARLRGHFADLLYRSVGAVAGAGETAPGFSLPELYQAGRCSA
jgi:hypothetical protein